MHSTSSTKPGRLFQTAIADGSVEQRLETYSRAHDEGSAHKRRARASDLSRTYYDLATDFYEFGWGRSFHFAPMARNESFDAAIVRHEHYLASRLGLGPGMLVLDAGCGVCGPMLGISRFSGARIVGLNVNRYQLTRGRKHIASAGLESACSLVQGDFTSMPFASSTFDAAFVIESACHASDRGHVFSDALRLLKPGALLAGYDWCLTESYDPDDSEHRRIKQGIEKGNGLPELVDALQIEASLSGSGFHILEIEDRSATSDPGSPWFSPLADGLSLQGFLHSSAGAWCTHKLVSLLERTHLSPPGTTGAHDLLRLAQRSLVEAGRLGIFTPMLFYLAEKP